MQNWYGIFGRHDESALGGGLGHMVRDDRGRLVQHEHGATTAGTIFGLPWWVVVAGLGAVLLVAKRRR